jgi:serpin B
MKSCTGKVLAVASFLILLLVMMAGCTSSPASGTCTGCNDSNLELLTPPAQAGPGQPGTLNLSITDANNRFAAGLYREIAQGRASGGGNIFFSPISISSALALTYEGARGKTADEIQSVFYFPVNDTTRREGFAAITAGINQGDSGYTLSTANALWAEKTSAFLPGYTSIAQQYYSANTTNLDIVGEPDASRQTINDWVAAKTNNKILDLLPAGSISSMTRFVITNAVYFKGTWEKQFDANQTSDAPFTRSDGTVVTASMMQMTGEDAVYSYAETPDLQMLSLPYTTTSGAGLSMVVLLPKENNLSAAAPYLDPANLSALERSASSRRVMVYLPKFKLEHQYSLKDVLSAMGMPTAFSGAAEFSGMDGAQDLYISDVYHKAYIEVNEEGTEAAAATGVVMNMMAVAPGSEEPVPVFRADRPFLFLIQDNDTGAILFAGQVTDPTGS